MAINDIGFLHNELPEVFAKKNLPTNLAEDWIIIPVDSLENETPFDITEQTNTVAPPPSLEEMRSPVSDKQLPTATGCFPGGPISSWPKEYFPPTDALAFYLPFHYFYSDWWGIYLTVEGIYILGKYIYEKRSDILTLNNSMIASQVFLYAHEA